MSTREKKSEEKLIKWIFMPDCVCVCVRTSKSKLNVMIIGGKKCKLSYGFTKRLALDLHSPQRNHSKCVKKKMTRCL